MGFPPYHASGDRAGKHRSRRPPSRRWIASKSRMLSVFKESNGDFLYPLARHPSTIAKAWHANETV
jgi:hypothetical protein